MIEVPVTKKCLESGSESVKPARNLLNSDNKYSESSVNRDDTISEMERQKITSEPIQESMDSCSPIIALPSRVTTVVCMLISVCTHHFFNLINATKTLLPRVPNIHAKSTTLFSSFYKPNTIRVIFLQNIPMFDETTRWFWTVLHLSGGACRAVPRVPWRRLVALLTLVVPHLFGTAQGHGRLVDPPSRGTMWRLGFDTPPDYNDHELYCGGFERQWGSNEGKCGECGDPWDLTRPRPHEAGGVFGTGTLSKVYRQGQIITAVVHLTANHEGWFEFRICPTNDPLIYAKQSCLNKHVLKLADHPGTRYEIKNQSQGLFRVRLELPRGIACSHCVLQWHYTTGNNWGFCRDGNDKMGCGKQEVFRGCSDVAIFEQNDPSYYRYLNLTIEADLAPIINIEDGTYQQNKNNLDHDDDNQDHPSGEDNNDDHDLIIHHVHHHEQQSDDNDHDDNDGDDLDKLDGDGDGVINIDGNLLSIHALKNHLLKSGLLSSDGNLSVKENDNKQRDRHSNNDLPTTTTRTRTKYQSVRNRSHSESRNQETVDRHPSYVTPIPHQEHAQVLFHTEEEQDKNPSYIPSDSFRRSSFFASFNDPEITTVTPAAFASPSSIVTEYTLGPVIVHRTQDLKREPAQVNNLRLSSSQVSFKNSPEYVIFKRAPKTTTTTLPPTSTVTITTNALPNLLNKMAALNRQVLPQQLVDNPVIHISPTSTDHEELLEAVQNLFAAIPSTTPQPSTQLQRSKSKENKVYIPNIIISPKSVPRETSSARRRQSLKVSENTFPPNIFSNIVEPATSPSPRLATTRPPTPRPRTRSSTSSSLLAAETTIRNLAAQTQLFSKHRHTTREDIMKTQPRLDTASSGNSISSITSHSLASKKPDMAGAVAFQVPLSKLRESATIDKLLELKNSLRPDSDTAREVDPILLIIM